MKFYKFNENYELVSATEEEMNHRMEPQIPIPVDAKVVYKGTIFTAYNWNQKMFDGSTSVFETLKRPDSVGIIPVTVDGKFILTRQEQPGQKPFTGVIGGRVDEGEKLIDAAVRELSEEAGIIANEWIEFLNFQGVIKIDWASKMYFVRDWEMGKSHYESGEKIELVYLSFDEFVDEVTKKDYRDSEITFTMFQIIKAGKLSNLRNSLLK